MYRKGRSSGGSGILDLDSLMDILSCLVGVMLFMVIYTVLELGSTAFQVSMPPVRDPPPGGRRVVVLALDGTVRFLDTQVALTAMLDTRGSELATDLTDFVRAANERAPPSPHFTFALEARERSGVVGAQVLDLRVDELPGAVGDSVGQLEVTSDFRSTLNDLDPDDVWLELWVDDVSLDVFREARDLASSRGYTTRWAPFEYSMPLTFPVSAGGIAGQTPRGGLVKPQR